jgi:hypothetical protein
MRILIKVGYFSMRSVSGRGLMVGLYKLDDQFEWDVDNDGASPERFAEVYASELWACWGVQVSSNRSSLSKEVS